MRKWPLEKESLSEKRESAQYRMSQWKSHGSFSSGKAVKRLSRQ
jgi:hypothetical protein